MGDEILVLINESVFQRIQQETLLVFKFNGNIIQKNRSAEMIFPTENFFDHFVGELKKEIYQFTEKLIRTGVICQIKIPFNNRQLILKGLVEDELIYLSVFLDETSTYEEQKIAQITKWSWDNLNIGVLGVDANDQIIECNEPSIGYLQLQQDLIGRNYRELLNGKPFLNLFVNMIEEIRSNHGPIQRYYYDQEVFYQLQSFYYMEDQSVYIFISDNTYLQKFENLLIYKEQMEQVSHLAAGVAHEIRNPLSVIKGFIQLANHTKRFDHFYGTVMSEIDRMNEIIEDFLAVSRKSSLKRSKHKPHEIIKSIISIMQSECLLHGIHFQHFFDIEQNQVVEVNDGMMKQVMLNLLRNAIEAFNDSLESINNKQISIHACHMDGYYKIEFIDNGPGMDEDILKQIGKPFFTTKEKGTGIGLPMCKKIIHDHGGNFTIDSTVGKGTVIRFTIPLIKTQ